MIDFKIPEFKHLDLLSDRILQDYKSNKSVVVVKGRRYYGSSLANFLANSEGNIIPCGQRSRYSGTLFDEKKLDFVKDSIRGSGKPYISIISSNLIDKLFWENSTQYYYHFYCNYCDDLYIPYTLGNDLWFKTFRKKETYTCSLCNQDNNRPVSLDRGQWVALNPRADNISYHLSVCLNPGFISFDIIKPYLNTKELMGDMV